MELLLISMNFHLLGRFLIPEWKDGEYLAALPRLPNSTLGILTHHIRLV